MDKAESGSLNYIYNVDANALLVLQVGIGCLLEGYEVPGLLSYLTFYSPSESFTFHFQDVAVLFSRIQKTT